MVHVSMARAEKTWMREDALFSTQLHSLHNNQDNPVETGTSYLSTRPDTVLHPASL